MKNIDEPVRILQHMRVLDSGGIEAFIFANYRKMDRKKVVFDFLVTRDKKEFYDDEIEKLGGNKIVLDFKKTGNSIMDPIRQARAFYQFCKANKDKYKVIHFQSIGANGFMDIIAARIAGIPVRIAHSHIANDIKPQHNSKKQTAGFIRKKLVLFRQSIIRRLVSSNATDFFGCSKMACQWMFTKKINSTKSLVVKNPIDTDKFKYNEKVRNKIRKELNIQDKIVIGHVGRFVYSKNHGFLLELVKEAISIDNNVVLLLVGGGKLEKEIKKYAAELGIKDNIIFYGETSKVYEVYNAMDIFLFPSIYEGLGIVLVEAQANGLPVIASKSIPEEVMVTDNFKFIDLEDSKDKWISEIKNSIGKRNLNNFKKVRESGYDIKDVSQFLEEFYLEANKKAK